MVGLCLFGAPNPVGRQPVWVASLPGEAEISTFCGPAFVQPSNSPALGTVGAVCFAELCRVSARPRVGSHLLPRSV